MTAVNMLSVNAEEVPSIYIFHDIGIIVVF
jgi:hypothetical protein